MITGFNSTAGGVPPALRRRDESSHAELVARVSPELSHPHVRGVVEFFDDV